jgi:stearoyl-CoA desaturase (delta-9 desaturase)
VLRPLFYVIGTLLVSQAAVIATSVYLHRGLAHRALRLHPLADWGFRFVLWFTTGQNRREWVAVHRKHHAFTDTEKDRTARWCTASGRSSSGTSTTTCVRPVLRA